jgi:DHA2 family multidrug resistance protein
MSSRSDVETLPSRTGEWSPSFNPWLIALAVMIATFMEVLDTSVANVSLPHIAGSLSASTDEATWVLTSYLVSNAIILPATSWLAGMFGDKSAEEKLKEITTLILKLAGYLVLKPGLEASRGPGLQAGLAI